MRMPAERSMARLPQRSAAVSGVEKLLRAAKIPPESATAKQDSSTDTKPVNRGG